MIQSQEITQNQERIADPQSTIQTTNKIAQSNDEQIPEHRLNLKQEYGTDTTSQNQNNTNTMTNFSILDTPANEVWAEIKVKDKSIQKRCYHISFIYNSRLYVHGGYETNSGRLSDFAYIEIKEDFSFEKWIKIETKSAVKPKGLCRHSGTVWQNTLYIFGGQQSSTDNTNDLWAFNLEDNTWNKIEHDTPKVKVPSLDSHSGLLHVDSEGEPHLIVTCGFIGDELGDYTNQIMSYNISVNKWEILFPHTTIKKKSNSGAFPSPRGGHAAIINDGLLYIFGGTEGDKRFNDMWTFNLKTKLWCEITYSGNVPDPRSGHTLNQYDKDHFVLFGGFQDIAHERDDLMVFNIATSEWQIVEQESMQGKSLRKASFLVEEGRSKSPTRLPERKKSPSRRITLSRSPSRSPERKSSINMIIERQQSNAQTMPVDNNRSMATINEETYQKYNKKKDNSDINKMVLLKNFEVNDQKLKERLSIPTPTTEAMKRSIIGLVSKKVTQNTQLSPDKDKELNTTKGTNFEHASLVGLNNGQVVLEGKIWGKRPSARDGHTAHVHKGMLVIFGGDRHKMTFNDIYIYHLDKALESPRLER